MSLFGEPSVAKLKAKGDRDGLVKALSKPDMTVRLEAAEALSSLGWSPETDGQRLDFLVASGSWGQVTELGRARPQLLVERFLGEARHHRGDKVGVGGIPVGGGQMGELSTPSGEDVRCLLVSALRDVGEPAVAPLASALDGDDIDGSSHASWALVDIGEAALDLLIARYMPGWSGGSFNTKSVGTIALAARRSRERGGQGFVSHLHSYQGDFNSSVIAIVADLAGEGTEFAHWKEGVIDASLEKGPDALSGISCTLTVPDEKTASAIASSDEDGLREILLQIPVDAAKVLLRALKRGRPISREVSRNAAGGGFSVKLTLLPGGAQDSAPKGAGLSRREDEIAGRLAEVDQELASERNRIMSASQSSNDAEMGNILIASVYEKLGQAPPSGTHGLGRVTELEAERSKLVSELTQCREAVSKGTEGSS